VSWSRALACWVLAGVLALAYLGSAPSAPPAVERAPEPPPARERAYTLDPAALRTVELRRGEDEIVLERRDGGWAVAQPTDRTIPAGLVQAFVEQLVDGGAGERVGDDPHDPAFGFGEPQLRVTATGADGMRFTLVVGAMTPTGTAAYGRVGEQGAVVLVGRNLLYYADLLFG